MGDILSLRCECGYVEPWLIIGSGAIRAPECVPALCARCRRIVAEPEGPQMRCPECRGALSVIALPMTRAATDIGDDELDFPDDKPDDDPAEIDFDARLTCPRCGQLSLVMTSEGIWD